MANPRRSPPQRQGPNLFFWFLFLAASGLRADPPPAGGEWPQWRGPLGTGVAPAADPPVVWSETKNIKWKVKVPGAGAATPIIWGQRIFIQTAIPKEASAEGAPRKPEPHEFTLLCLDRQSGKTLWQRVARVEAPHEGHHPDHGFSSYSPVTDGKHVIAFFGSRGLHSFDLSGEPAWQKDLGRMRTRNGFGEGSSPGLSGGTIVINWDHEGEDFVAALDKETGKELWRQARDEQTSWATPLIVEHEGKAQAVIAAARKIRSYDLASGKPIWECAGLTSNVIPTPVAGNGMVFAMSGYRGSALLGIRLGRTGDLTGTDAIAWSHPRGTPYVPSPLLYDGRLYFFAGNNGILSCLEAGSGRPLFERERLEGVQGVYSSPVGAGGRVYVLGRGGVAVVLKHSGSLEPLATNRLDERFDASPALAGKEIFLRGHHHLYCIAEG